MYTKVPHNADQQGLELGPANAVQQRMEISPRFCDLAIARWQNFTGHEAVRDGTLD